MARQFEKTAESSLQLLKLPRVWRVEEENFSRIGWGLPIEVFVDFMPRPFGPDVRQLQSVQIGRGDAELISRLQGLPAPEN